jgi:hypothetical protein
VTYSSLILKDFSCKNESLLLRMDSLFVLDFGFDNFNSVCLFHLENHCPSSEFFDKDLHSPSESQYKMESRFFCDVVISKSSLVLEVLSCEDKSLLARRDSLLVLYFSL